MAREAVASPPAGITEPEPVQASTADPEPTSLTRRRQSAPRSRQISRESTPGSGEMARPEVVRNTRAVVSLALVIGLIVLGLALYLALAASTP